MMLEGIVVLLIALSPKLDNFHVSLRTTAGGRGVASGPQVWEKAVCVPLPPEQGGHGSHCLMAMRGFASRIQWGCSAWAKMGISNIDAGPRHSF